MGCAQPTRLELRTYVRLPDAMSFSRITPAQSAYGRVVLKLVSPLASQAGTPALAVSHLVKVYGHSRAVDDVTFAVHAGEILGFVGPNGAGKSTTIRMIAGLVQPTSGSVSIFGSAVTRSNPMVRAHLGYLPGTPALYPRLTSRACLGFVARVRGMHLEARIEELAERLNLNLDQHIHDLSRGNKQKTALIAALMHQPRVLLLDEPTSGLDPLVQRDVENLLRAEAARGVAILLSSHVLSEVEAVADRVVMLDRGAVIMSASMADINARLSQRLSFEFTQAAQSGWVSALPGVHEAHAHGSHLECVVDGSQATVLREVAAHDVVSVHTHERRLEDVFTSLIEERAA